VTVSVSESSERDAFEAAARIRRCEPETLRRALERALAAHLRAVDVEIGELRHPVGAGTSSETVLFRAEWIRAGERQARDLVMRVHPDRFQLFLEPDFAIQFRVLEVLHREGLVRVPEPLLFESESPVLGLPFYVMSQLKGRVPVTSPPYMAKGWVVDATPAQRRVLWTTAMEELCRIATVPVSLVSFLARPDLGASGLEQQLEYWRRAIDWSTGGQHRADGPDAPKTVPDVYPQLHAWLRANLPADRPDGLAWGDARIGNMMFADDFRLAGVMDWEQVNLGGARQDLGWWLFFDHFHTELRGLRRLDGLGSRDETIAFWEARTGMRAGDLRWYEVFAAFKVALLMARTRILLGDRDTRGASSNPVVGFACESAGIAPAR
jgi:aminoglycoside phosphotransferase (APT) family kinase protein